MQLSRSVPLILLTAGLLATACGTERRKSKAPEAQPELPIAPPEKLECSLGQVLDADNKTCRKPTERECLQNNKVFNGVTCDVYLPTLGTEPAHALRIDLAAFCEKNTAGAFTNCKDGVFSLPVTAIPHVEGTPEAFQTMTIDQEFKLQHSIKVVGDIKISLDLGTETVDALKPTDSNLPWLLRNLKVGDAIPLKVSFAADTIIHGKSEIRIIDQFVTYHDKAQILTAIADKTVSNKWLSDETTRQAKARLYRSTLNNEWLTFLKKDVKGDVVWSLHEKCPADQQRNFLATSICAIDQKVDSQPAWKNQAFLNTCTYVLNVITIEYLALQERYGLLNYGKFQTDDFSISIPKNTRFIGPACFIKIIE